MAVKNLFFGVLVCFLLGSSPLSAQQYFRIRADVSVKTKLSTGDQSLTVGKVYYDRNEKQILYVLSFPEQETILTADTVTYRIKEGEITQRTFSPSLAEFSVFHLALSSKLPDYGLKKTQYKISDVTREGEMVITNWEPPKSLKDDLGKIVISVMDKKLFGVVFFSPNGEVSSKQLFEDYIEQDGMAFPGKIIEISYSPEGENYQIMSFKNLVIDELENNDKYSYHLPNRK